MDPKPDLQARRLFVSAALTTQALRSIRGRVAAGGDAKALLTQARNLDVKGIERGHRLSFEPSYPGVTAGVEVTSGGLRLLLACRAFDRDGEPLGVVFTALIPGRVPQVSIAPIATPIPEGWLPPEEPA